MTVNNGERVNAAVTNSSFVSKEATTGNEVTGIIDLNNTTDPNSGAQIPNIQEKVNDNADRITENESDISDIRTTTGTADGDTDMSTYTAGPNAFNVTDDQNIKTNIQELIDGVDARQLLSEKGVANGYAELDGTGKIPASQLPTSAMEYKGAYDASGGGSGSPSLTDGVGDTGDFYRVSAAGTVDHGSGSVTYGVGDAVVYNGSVWQKIPAEIAQNLTDLLDVNVPTPTDDDFLYWNNSAGEWQSKQITQADGSIDTHSDVDTTTVAPVVDQGLVWDGSNWVPGDLATGSGSGLKNFFSQENSELEVDDVTVDTDWYAFDDGAVTVPVNGVSAAATNVSISNSVSTETITQSVQAGAVSQSNALTVRGQTFTPSSTGVIQNYSMWHVYTSTQPVGTIKYVLYATAGGVPTGSPLAETNTLNVSAFTTVMSEYNLSFTTEYTVNASTQYAVILDTSGISSYGSVWQIGDNNTNPYAGGTRIQSLDGGSSYTTSPSNDAQFKVVIGSNNAIEGANSLLVSKAAADSQGEGVSVDSDLVDILYQGKIGYGSFGYDTTNVNYAGSWQVWMYDVTNSTRIDIIESDNSIPAGEVGRFSFSFIVPDGCDSLRFIAMETDTNANAYDLILDVLKAGPDTLQVSIPYKRSEIIDLTGSGGFTGGTMQVERIENTVTLTTLSNLTYASANSVTSGVILPEWARPSISKSNVTRVTSLAYECLIAQTGTITLSTRDSSFSPAATSSDFGYTAITYAVDDDGQTVSGTVQNSLLAFDSVYLAGDFSDSTATFQKMPLDTVLNGTNFDTVNNIWTCPVSAVYAIEMKFLTQPNDQEVQDISIYNQTKARREASAKDTGARASDTSTPQVSWIGFIEKGDEIYMEYRKSTASARTYFGGVTNTYMNIMQIPFTDTSIVQQNKVAIIKDKKASGAIGGASIAGQQFRTLNTIESDKFGLIKSLSGDAVELGYGTYLFEAITPFYNTQRSRTYITDDLNTQRLLTGNTWFANSGLEGSCSEVAGIITVGPGTFTKFKVRQYTQAANASGLGLSTGDGGEEVYTTLKITKVGE